MGPSTFFFKKAGVFSSNYKVYQGGAADESKLWLYLKRKGSWFSDHSLYILENFVRGGGPEKDDGQVLAVCSFEKLAGDAFMQYDVKTHADSDNSDGYSFDSDSDNEQEFKQKLKWRMKVKSRFYLDRERSREVYTLVAKAKGKARRDVRFEEYRDNEGREQVRTQVNTKIKVKKMVYHLTATGTNVEIPIVIVGSLSKSANHLTWESPLFRGEVEKGFSEKAVIETREGNPALNALIGFITTIELSPDDVREKANLRWPTVRGPHGSFA